MPNPCNRWQSPLATVITLQATRGPGEEVESHACEKLFTLGYRDGDLLPLTEGAPVFTGQRRVAFTGITGGLYRHSHGL